MNFKLDWDTKPLFTAVDGKAVALVRRGAKLVLADAKAGCPVEKVGRKGRGIKKRVPGSLRDSGRIVEWKKDDAVGVYVQFGGRGWIINGVDTYYGIFVALGTPGTTKEIKLKEGGTKTVPRVAIDASPFLQNALRKNHARIMAGAK